MIDPLRRFAALAARWPRYTSRQIRSDGLDGARRAIEKTAEYAVAGGSRAFVEEFGNVGTPVWEREWDVLVVLDACRVDLIREVAREYPFIGGPERVGRHWSVASKSDDWMARTFVRDYANVIERTAYVTGNPFTARVAFESRPRILDEVWKYAWDDDLSTIPARPITDRAIETWRERDVDRMIVHYMQPHVPFVARPELGAYGGPEDFGSGFMDFWPRVGSDYGFDEVWDAYRDNLRYVLDDIGLLLENLDAGNVVLTADHGNAVGELGIYGHPSDVLLPCIRWVPWIRTRGRDDHTRSSDVEREPTESSVENRLRDLGYTE